MRYYLNSKDHASGTVITGTVRQVGSGTIDGRDLPYVVLGNVCIDNIGVPYEFTVNLNRTNRDILTKLDIAHNLIGQHVRLMKLRYETQGYNGALYPQEGFLFQPLNGRPDRGKTWRLL